MSFYGGGGGGGVGVQDLVRARPFPPLTNKRRIFFFLFEKRCMVQSLSGVIIFAFFMVLQDFVFQKLPTPPEMSNDPPCWNSSRLVTH